MSAQYKFNKDKSYKIGVLKRNEDASSPNPEFMTNPNPVTWLGSQMVESGWTDITAFLQSPRNPFPEEKTLHFYEINNDASLKFVGTGNPLKRKGGDGLSDKDMPFHFNFNTPKDNTNITKYHQQTIDFLQEQLNKTKEENTELRQKILNLEQEKSNIESERYKLQLWKEWKEENEVKGLGDNGGSNIIQDIIKILSDPNISGLVSAGAAAAKQKFFGGQGPAQPPSQFQQMPPTDAANPNPNMNTANDPFMENL